MKNTIRRTKIVATLGPATSSRESLKKLIMEGVDIVRLNFSHGKAEDHIARANLIRDLTAEIGHEIAILADLQGPKIRIGRFVDGGVDLKNGQEFVLDAAYDIENGNDKIVGIDYKELPKDVANDDILLLDDGKIVFKVNFIDGDKINCTVLEAGRLLNNKGVNRKGGGLSAPALTDKDKTDLKTAVQLGADFIAISFVRGPEDVLEARALIEEAGGESDIVSKIERADALLVLDDIIKASDAVMVARGDLGVEIGDAELIGVQKRIIGRARALDRAVITATQMMESMISNPVPTRAEVFDVANAVLDGTDAVMLSAESATGQFPDMAVAAMARVILGAEKERSTQVSGHRLECEFARVDEAIAMSTMYAANHLDVKAIVALTESGATTRWMSRIRSAIPIFALSRHTGTLRKSSIYRGVYSMAFDSTILKRSEVNIEAVQVLVDKGILTEGDLVILTKGDYMGLGGSSNTMKIVRVGAVV